MEFIESSDATPLPDHVRSRVPYSRTRISVVTIGLASAAAAALALATWSIWQTRWSSSPPPVIGVPIVLLTLVLTAGAIFSCFTVEVRDSTLAWWFGFGAFRRELRLSAIADAEATRVSWAELHTIPLISQRRAYGATAGDAVRVQLHDGTCLKLQAREPAALLVVLVSRI